MNPNTRKPLTGIKPPQITVAKKGKFCQYSSRLIPALSIQNGKMLSDVPEVVKKSTNQRTIQHFWPFQKNPFNKVIRGELVQQMHDTDKPGFSI